MQKVMSNLFVRSINDRSCSPTDELHRGKGAKKKNGGNSKSVQGKPTHSENRINARCAGHRNLGHNSGRDC